MFRLILLSFSLLAFSNSFAQHHPKCDCSWQGGDKRQYGTCAAEIELTPFQNSNSSITDFFLEATVDTEKCTNVNYKLYKNGSFQENGMIHVRDGSNSLNIDGSQYSSTPEVVITDCVVCQDERFTTEIEKSEKLALNGKWCMSLERTNTIVTINNDLATYSENGVVDTTRYSFNREGNVQGQEPNLQINWETKNSETSVIKSIWDIKSVSDKTIIFFDATLMTFKSKYGPDSTSAINTERRFSRCD